jgi:hypothetical protein
MAKAMLAEVTNQAIDINTHSRRVFAHGLRYQNLL